MRVFLLLSFLAMSASVSALAPVRAQPLMAAASAQSKPQAKPASPAKPAAAAPAQAASRSGIALTVTDPTGATLPGVQVEVTGPTDRADMTNESGQVNFTGLRAGTYRLRFTGDMVTAFEREVTVRARQILSLDITLNPAPPPKVVEAPPPPEPATPSVAIGPVGQPHSLTVTDVLEKEFVGREPRRETLLSCSANMRTTMIQLNDPLPPRLYDNADVIYYVLGGEGTITIEGRDSELTTNGFASVPRGMSHSISRRGNRPLIVLAVLGGSPCEEAL